MPTISNSTPILIKSFSYSALPEPDLSQFRLSLAHPQPDPSYLLSQLATGDPWMVKGIGEHGLILDYGPAAELVLFGSAVGMSVDQKCQQVIPIGTIYLVRAKSYLERQWSRRRRIQGINWHQSITEAYQAEYRTYRLLADLHQLFSPATVADLPDLILAKLVGLSPEKVQAGRTLYQEHVLRWPALQSA